MSKTKTSSSTASGGCGLFSVGGVLAFIVSWKLWHSFWWALLAALFGWGYMEFCDNHWRMRFGHQFDTLTWTCIRCKQGFKGSGRTCLMSPYLDQPPSVYPEPSVIRNEGNK